ncbi:MAG TPA: arginine repressor [Clostridiales bacterium]|jgi:transcriptional regulator of arginine metabolism|nr:arginine repressor [Clostridiales bacterium]
MKSSRQTAILSLVEQQDIKTQEELAEKLRERGISVTQATVSRDIKELRLLKVMSEGGGYKYATADRAEHGISERFVRMFVDSVISINYSGNIVVIRTLAGSANVAGEAIDNMRWSEILGTLSGDNTIFVVTRTPEDAPNVVERFREIIR